MSSRLMLLFLLIACPLLATASTAAAPRTENLRGSSAAKPHHEDTAATDAAGTSVEDQEGNPDKPEAEPLDIDALKDASEAFLPSKVAVIVVGGLTTVKAVHDNIQAAFKNMPGNSCLFLMGFLGMFCWTVLGMMWRLDEPLLLQLGTWTTLSSYLATANLMLTPIILVMPDQQKSKELAKKAFKKAQEAVQDAYENNKCLLALLYLVVMIFQLISAVSVFRVGKVKQAAIQGGMNQMQQSPLGSGLGLEDGSMEDVTGPVMATVLYLILSWCSLCVLYERMFPGGSFAADFPVKVLENAFPGFPLFKANPADQVNPEEAANEAIAKAEAAQAEVAGSPAGQAAGKAAQEQIQYLSSAVHNLLDSFMSEADGITVKVAEFVEIFDSYPILFYLHYAAYLTYGVGTLIFTGWLGFRISRVVLQMKHVPGFGMWYVVFMDVALVIIVCFFGIIFLLALYGVFAEAEERNSKHKVKRKRVSPDAEEPQFRVSPATTTDREDREDREDAAPLTLQSIEESLTDIEAICADCKLKPLVQGSRGEEYLRELTEMDIFLNRLEKDMQPEDSKQPLLSIEPEIKERVLSAKERIKNLRSKINSA